MWSAERGLASVAAAFALAVPRVHGRSAARARPKLHGYSLYRQSLGPRESELRVFAVAVRLFFRVAAPEGRRVFFAKYVSKAFAAGKPKSKGRA